MADYLDDIFGAGASSGRYDPFGEPERPSQQIAPERGLMGDIGSHLYRGGLGLVETIGEAGERMGIESGVDEWAEEKRQTSSFAAPDVSEYMGEGYLKRTGMAALEATPTSFAPGLLGGAAMGALGGSLFGPLGTAVGGAIGGFMGAAGLIGLSESQKGYEEGLKQGMTEEKARAYGNLKGLSEGSLEGLAMAADLLIPGLGRAGRVGRVARKAVTPADLVRVGPGKIAQDIGTMMGIEAMTEVAQLETGASIDRAYGLEGEVTWQDRFDAMGTAMWMSGAFGGVATGMTTSERVRLKNALEGNKGKEAQFGAGKTLYNRLKKQDKELADAWRTHFTHAMANDIPIKMDTAIIESNPLALPEPQKKLPDGPKDVDKRKAEAAYDRAREHADAWVKQTAAESASSVDEVLEAVGVPIDDPVDTAREEARLQRLREKAGEFGAAITKANRGEVVEEMPLDKPRAADDPKLAENVALIQQKQAEQKAAKEAPIRGAVGAVTEPLQPTQAEAMEGRAQRQAGEAQLRAEAPGVTVTPEMAQPVQVAKPSMEPKPVKTEVISPEVQPEAVTSQTPVEIAKDKYQKAAQAQDQEAMDAAVDELTEALLAEEEGMSDADRIAGSKAETDAALQEVIDSVEDPAAKQILEGVAPTEAIDAEMEVLQAQYEKDLRDWEADPEAERDPAQKPPKPTRNRAFENVLDRVARDEPGAADAIRWASQDIDTRKTAAKVTETGVTYEDRTIGDTKWQVSKDQWKGESLDGKKKYFINNAGKNKKILVEIDKDGKQKEIGTFKTQKAAAEAVSDTGDTEVRKVGKRFKVFSKDGKALHSTTIRKKLMARQLQKELAENPDMDVAARVTELNKLDTAENLEKDLAAKPKKKAAIQKLREKAGVQKDDATRSLKDANEAYLRGEELTIEEQEHMWDPDWDWGDPMQQIDETPSDIDMAMRDPDGEVFFKGKVSDRSKKQALYFQALLKNLGLKSTNIVVQNGDRAVENVREMENRGDGFSYVTNWMRAQFSKIGKGTDASVHFHEEHNTVYLTLFEKNLNEYTDAAIAEIIAHEMGHVVEAALFHQAPKKTKQAILNAYFEYLDKGLASKIKDEKLTLEDYYHVTESFNTVLERKKMTQRKLKWDMFARANIEHLEERTSFPEWFAEQTAKWATTTKKPSGVLETFFAGVAKHMRKLIGLIKKQAPEALPNKEVTKFLNDMWDTAEMRKEDPDYNPQEDAWANSAIEMWRGKQSRKQFEFLMEHDGFRATQARLLMEEVANEPILDFEIVESDSAVLDAAKGNYKGSYEDAMKYHRSNETTKSEKFKAWNNKIWKDANKWRVKAFSSGIDRIAAISPRAEKLVNRWILNMNKRNAQYKQRTRGFDQAFAKLGEADRNMVAQLLYNNQRDHLKKHFPQIARHMKAVDEVLDDIRTRAMAAGLVVEEEIENYFPRKVTDPEMLSAALEGSETGSRIKQEIVKARLRAKELDIEFTPDHEAEVMNSVMQTGQYFGSLKKPGALKERGIKQIHPSLVKFYENPSASLQDHIIGMNEAISTQEFLGGRVRKAEMKKLDKLKGQISRATGPEKISLEQQYVAQYEKLTNHKNEQMINESISDFLATEFREGELSEKQVDDMIDIIRARAMEKGMHGPMNTFRNIGLMTTLTDFTSLITQASEILLSMYYNGPITALQGFVSKKQIKATELDIQRMQTEYQDKGSSALVAKVLKMVGFAKVDIYMKESFMQAALIKARKDMNKKKFNDKWGSYFNPEEMKALKKELKSGEAGPLSTELAWASQMRFQPLDTIANPEAYMLGGNGRMLYMLKTFQLRQLNALVRESWGEIQKGNVKQGLQNLFWLSTLIIMGGAGKDELRDLWLGRQTPFSEHVMDNVMNIFLFSRYDMDRAMGEGIGSQLLGKVLPPTPFLDHPYTDAMHYWKTGEFKGKTITMVPYIGKIFYDRVMPAGKEREINSRKKQHTDALKKAIRSGQRDALVLAKRNIRAYNRGAPKEGKITNSAISRAISSEKTKMQKERRARKVVAKHATRLGVPKDRAMENMRTFSDLVAYAENRGKLQGKNPNSSAKGMYQITDDTMITALNRLKRDVALEPWMKEAMVHKDANQLDKDQQEALFLANLMYRAKTDPLIEKVMEGDIGAMTELYMKHHHTKPDPATERNWQTALKKVIGA